MFKIMLVLAFLILSVSISPAQQSFEKDIIKSPTGDITITFIGHGTLMIEFDNKIIHVDPWSRAADYSTLPKADLILVTHEHGDHLDRNAVAAVRTEKTVLAYSESCSDQLGQFGGGTVMKNGTSSTLAGLKVDAVPAYNIVHKRDGGGPFHPRGVGNGYIITLGGMKLYIAGDTENIPEMKALTNIDIAFLPMNLPYTMTPEMAADAALAFKPAILYPYHFGDTDTSELVTLLKGADGIEVRIRKME
ncbi:MBL fold metallo-hydrolase [Candidatus Latescibacterota bacterium]